MTAADVVATRAIREVVHFTTDRGLLGTLASRALLSRKRLKAADYLEHILHLNCAVRKDAAWLDYANLSITRINASLFNISSKNWHRAGDVWWCVLAIDPVVLSHDGVVFTTTNNIYTAVSRGKGAAGLEALFAPKIQQYNTGHSVSRPRSMPSNEPTCVQAEVLYPGQVSLEFVTKVYLASEEHEDAIQGQCSALGLKELPCEVNLERFE